MKYEDEIIISKRRRTLERETPFVFIGNEIDGQLFCQTFYEFENFEELRERLPDILKSIKGKGSGLLIYIKCRKSLRSGDVGATTDIQIGGREF